jgi:ferredoxin-like protein FixX
MLDWEKYIAVADRFQHKAKAQDREDLKHTIILKLAQVASSNGHKTFTEATMCRIASYIVADYWREQYKLTNGLDCGSCSRTQRQKCRKDWQYPECPKAIKIEYLSKPIIDDNGNITELGELIADDKAIDLDAWLDAKTFLLGFPKRLMEIAHKIDNGDNLNDKDRQYLSRYRQKEQKPLLQDVTI